MPTALTHIIAAILLLSSTLIPCRANAPDGGEADAMTSEIAALEKRLGENPNDMDILQTLCSRLTAVQRFEDVIKYSARLRTQAESQDNPQKLLLSYGYGAQAYLATLRNDLGKLYLDRGFQYWESLRDKSVEVDPKSVFAILNGLGIYSLSVEMDYHKAVAYFMEGLTLAESDSHGRDYAIFSANLARTYYLRNDPVGLKYALEVYRYGHDNADRHLISSGSYTCALLYYMIGDYAVAQKYTQEAMQLMDGLRDRTGLYTLNANILLALGDEKGAQENFEEALKHVEGGESTSVTELYLSYGTHVLDKGDYPLAIRVLEDGIRVSTETHSSIHRYKLFEQLSRAYSLAGNYREALDYYISYHQEADSIFNLERERSINEMRIRYESEKKENEIRENRLRLARQSRKLQVIASVLIIIVATLIAMYVSYRRKNMLYLQIVRQHQEAMKKQRRLEDHIEMLNSETAAPERNSGQQEKHYASSLKGEMGQELFERLERLMRTDRIYRERNLTKERVAEMINSNRTYLSQVINTQTGLSFNRYVNSFRINEAITLLSDPENDTPLKTIAYDLGFTALSSFYKLFQDEVGMPPSKYRQKVKELERRKNV